MTAAAPLRRVAFLVDNFRYGNAYWADLNGDHNTVDELFDLLDARGFRCEKPRTNVHGEGLQLLSAQIANSLRNTCGALALVCFFGHAMMFNGHLYFIPSEHAETSGLPGPSMPRLFALSLAIFMGIFQWRGVCGWGFETLGCAVGVLVLWKFLHVPLKKITRHPLSKALRFDQLEAQLANIHITHQARNATFVFLLDCCREYRRLSLWQRFLLGLQREGAQAKRSYNNFRPHFFRVFACEEGRLALGFEYSCGYLTYAFRKTLLDIEKQVCTLDEVLRGIEKNIRTCCSRGLQQLCVYSTSYRLAKDITLFDISSDAPSQAGPTLLTSMKKNQLENLKPGEHRLFHLHRTSWDPHQRKRVFSRLGSASDDLRALLLLRTLPRQRFLKTATFVEALKRHSLRPSMVQRIFCELQLMQAKFLCDKSIALLSQGITSRSPNHIKLKRMESIDRKLYRIERLTARAVHVFDQHCTDAYLRGKMEEVIAGSIAVHVLKPLLHFPNSWPSLQPLSLQAAECAGHFQRALHAYAEGSLTSDTARLAVIWQIASLFSSIFACDFHAAAMQMEYLETALVACNEQHPNYKKHWVIQRILKVVRFGCRLFVPRTAMMGCI